MLKKRVGMGISGWTAGHGCTWREDRPDPLSADTTLIKNQNKRPTLKNKNFMYNQNISKTFIPQVDGRGLDFIKAAAAIFMVIDHVNSMLLGSSRIDMFLIGRITFPLFCFALAMALFKAGDEKGTNYAIRRYAPRLFIFALLTEPISRFSRDIGDVYNVMFTLALGAVMAGLSLRMKDWQVLALCLIAIALMYFEPLFEFSAAGVMLPAAFLMALRGRPLALICLPAVLACINFGDYGSYFEEVSAAKAGLMIAMAFFCVVPPILLVRYAAKMPKTGRYLPKYFLHIFYPAHMLALWAIGRYILQLPT